MLFGTKITVNVRGQLSDGEYIELNKPLSVVIKCCSE